MEQETILYYYPLPAKPDDTDNTTAARKHWFQEAVLHTALLARQEEFCVLGCAVPPFSYRKRAWKAPVLYEAMETALHTAAGMTDTFVHPDILRLLGPERQGRWQPHEDTIKMLLKYLLGQQAGEAPALSGMVTVLLGQPRDAARQLETTWELLEPYLPRVNRMLLYYEGQERQQDGGTTGKGRGRLAGYDDAGEAAEADGLEAAEVGSMEAAEADGLEALQEYLEAYYYEYGLVPQPIPYRRTRTAESDPFSGENKAVLRCGKERCGGVILDFAEGYRYPKTGSWACVYIDVVSDGEKERLFGRKCPAAAYLSPLKYLDTLVKNSYDRKVKMT